MKVKKLLKYHSGENYQIYIENRLLSHITEAEVFKTIMSSEVECYCIIANYMRIILKRGKK